MTQTTTTLIPILQYLVAPAGAGWLASLLFDVLKRQFPHATIIHAPRYARWFALILAAAISVSASALVALLDGQAVLPAVDAALAASIGAIVSQLIHGQTLSTSTHAGSL